MADINLNQTPVQITGVVNIVECKNCKRLMGIPEYIAIWEGHPGFAHVFCPPPYVEGVGSASNTQAPPEGSPS